MNILFLVGDDYKRQICCSNSYEKLEQIEAELITYKQLLDSGGMKNEANRIAHEAKIKASKEYKSLSTQIQLVSAERAPIQRLMAKNSRADNVQLKADLKLVESTLWKLQEEQYAMLCIDRIAQPKYTGQLKTQDIESCLARPEYESYSIEECEEV
jgi:hypothetical protein